MTMRISHPLLYLTVVAVSAATVQAQPAELRESFLCCNMRTDGSWISDINYSGNGKVVIPAGTPVTMVGFGRQRVNLMINGKKQAIGNDYSRDLTLDAFARRYLVKEDPRPAIAAASPKIREAIESARVTKGMSRAQVLMSVGYPVSSENPNLTAKVWRFWLGSWSHFEVQFDNDGLVTQVTGDSGTLAVVYIE